MNFIKQHKAIKAAGLLMIPVFVVIASISGCSDSETEFTRLTLQEEFNTEGAPDTLVWTMETGTGNNGWGNSELQYYTDRTENITIQNGLLLITAREEDFGGSAYTSARMITKDKFQQQYGRFEARMRLPYGKGMWPAFWMLGADIDDNPWPAAGEIDVMEYVGQNPTIVFGSVHGPGYSGGEAVSAEYELNNDRFDTGFHVFAIEWEPESISYFVDGILYNTITPADVDGEWVFNKPFFLLINLAIGGNLPGSPDSETEFPQTMLVDYVRVYSN